MSDTNTKSPADTPTVDDLQKQLKSLEEKAQKLEKDNNELTVVNDSLTQEIEQITAKSPDLAKAQPDQQEWKTSRFKLKNIKYKFNFPSTIYKNKRITAQEVVENKDLQAELIEIGAEFFVPE